MSNENQHGADHTDGDARSPEDLDKGAKLADPRAGIRGSVAACAIKVIADKPSALLPTLPARRCPQGCLNLHDCLAELSLLVRSCRSQSHPDLWTKSWIARWAS